MELVAGWLLFSVLVALLAVKRGRNGLGWFVISVLLSPLFAALLMLIMPNLASDSAVPNPQTHVRCPDCRELVLKDARKCKHCGSQLVPQ